MKSPLAIFFRILFLIVVIALLLVGGGLAYFSSWRADRLADLSSESEVLETPLGKVEVLTRGDGPPLLVLHGALGGFDQGLLLADSLSGVAASVIAPSRPGYLRTPLTSGVLPEHQADLMAALLDKLEVPSADVLAFGEGASVALQLALRHPTRVEKLVLASPVIVHPTVADKRPFPDEVMAGLTGDTGSWLMYEASRRDPAAILDWLFPRESLRSPIQQKEARQFILDSPDQTVLFQELLDTTVPLSAREPGTRNDLVQTRVNPIPLDKVAVPVLIVQGELDAVIPVKDVQAMAAKIPGSQLVTIPLTGHLLMLGPGTEEAAQHIHTFLSTESTSPAEPTAPAQP